MLLSSKAKRSVQKAGSQGGVVVEHLIFNTRLVLVAFYVCAALALVKFVFDSCKDALSTALHFSNTAPLENVISILTVLDDVMVANVIYLIIAGSYLVYVKPKFFDDVVSRHEKRPQALQHLSPGTLKEKMAAALIGVSSVNLLSIMMKAGSDVSGGHEISWKILAVKVSIHLVLIIGFFAFWRANKAEDDAEARNEIAHLNGDASSNGPADPELSER